jgi:hypothetical protein
MIRSESFIVDDVQRSAVGRNHGIDAAIVIDVSERSAKSKRKGRMQGILETLTSKTP